jgi:hypothetical protein
MGRTRGIVRDKGKKKLHTGEIRNLYFSPSIIMVTKPKAEHLAGVEEMINTYGINAEEKNTLVGSRSRCEDNRSY